MEEDIYAMFVDNLNEYENVISMLDVVCNTRVVGHPMLMLVCACLSYRSYII